MHPKASHARLVDCQENSITASQQLFATTAEGVLPPARPQFNIEADLSDDLAIIE